MMSRFCRYIENVYDFGQRAKALSDSRCHAQVSTQSVWTNAFFLFAMRQGSLNAMEGQLRAPKRMEALSGSRKVSADTMGRVMNLIPPEQLQADLSHYAHRMRRNKALDENPWPLRFAVMDGHEFFSLLPSIVR
jgi:hypothetical protein